jgi:hypothetical protein
VVELILAVRELAAAPRGGRSGHGRWVGGDANNNSSESDQGSGKAHGAASEESCEQLKEIDVRVFTHPECE